MITATESITSVAECMEKKQTLKDKNGAHRNFVTLMGKVIKNVCF